MAEKQKDQANININVHPPVVALIHIAIAYLLGWLIPLPLYVPNILRAFGFVLVVIGFLFGMGAFIEFRRARTTLNPHGSVSSLVSSGVYRFTRNPIYLGFLLMLIGIPLNAGNYWGILLSPIFVILLNRLAIEREEAYLEIKFKDQYTAYKSRVRRWL
jgi:protein-S-isoprenylcysteine O-methyltransferase Ste14